MIKIKVADINNLMQKYLHEFNSNSLEDATLEQANKIFIAIITDYKSGRLSPDNLSSFGFEFFHKVGKKYPESDLFQASLSASELTFALRSKAVYKDISSYLEDVDKFLANNT